MNHAVLIDHRVAVGGQSPPQRHLGIERALLVEIDDLEKVGLLNPAGRRRDFTAQQPQHGGLAAAIRPYQADARSGGQNEIQVFEERAPADSKTQALKLNQSPGSALGGREVNPGGVGAHARVQIGQLRDHLVGGVDSGLSLGGARLWSPAQPLDFGAHAVLKRFLMAGLGAEECVLLHEKRAVVATHPQNSAGISAVEFDGFRADILQKITVVADYYAGEASLPQQLFQPFNTFKIEVIGRFIQQQDVGFLHQSFGDSQALAPAAGKRCRFGVEILKAGTAQGFHRASRAFVFRDARAFQRLRDDRANCQPRGKLRFLRDIPEPGVPAAGHVTAIRPDLA